MLWKGETTERAPTSCVGLNSSASFSGLLETSLCHDFLDGIANFSESLCSLDSMTITLTFTLQACSISLLAFSSALYLLGSCTLKNFKAPSKSACRRSSLEVWNETNRRTSVITEYSYTTSTEA